ncbi:MAG: hemin receptor [Prevotella sp.]|nr:hemin receptor [Prevotella sp.]
MKRIYIAIMALAAAMPSVAQETYENMKVAQEDLNGTARYVGMGGALEALGADISTISTNPAGVGLLRKSSVAMSLGLVSQEEAKDFSPGNKTNMSFDQAGFVWSGFDNDDSWLNFSFNYHKSRNFDFILSAADRLGNASQNKLTYAKAKAGLLYEVGTGGVPDFDHSYASCNQLDDIYARNLNYDTGENVWYYDNAQSYTMDRAKYGYIGEYDLNLSGAISNQVFLGLTVGIHDVNYRHYSEYCEQLDGFSLRVSDDRKIDGTGFDLKAGVIVRPVETSPFRIGAYVHTPTWYSLTTRNSTFVSDGDLNVDAGEAYDYKLYTPWRFGLSLGHTIGTMLALGATYEYTDYGSIDTRYITDSYYDWYGDYHDNSSSDDVMNRHTEQTLKGVSTLKLGAELKPSPEMAFRLGYNYVSPAYNKDGFKDGSLGTDGSYYSSATDYTNWDATHRITCGIGYQFENLNLSLAYQYQTTKGDFYPFMNYVDNEYAEDDNLCNAVKVNNKRHQVLFTLGYTF